MEPLMTEDALELMRAATAAEIVDAERRFPQMAVETLDVWALVLTEEAGKLARCANKLHLAQDPEVIAHWEREARYRMITLAAIATRLGARSGADASVLPSA